ncbi:hypothetical protein ACOMHN_025982 [Nucella lapillus]
MKPIPLPTTTTTHPTPTTLTSLLHASLPELSTPSPFTHPDYSASTTDGGDDDALSGSGSGLGGLNMSSSPADYIYDYDYDLSVSMLPLNELVVNAVGYGLVLILGLVGNILVVVSVARYRRMHNVTNIFLLSLATADLLLVCICVPVKSDSVTREKWFFYDHCLG